MLFLKYELKLDDRVFFVGDDADFTLSRNDYNGWIRNVFDYKDFFLEDVKIDGLTKVLDMETSTSSFSVES